MIIKFTRKEVLKLFKWRARRKLKKHEKKISKSEPLKKALKEIYDEFDHFLAFGEENGN